METDSEKPKQEEKPGVSPETLAKMSPIDRELAEMLMHDFPTLTEKKILAAIKAA